MWRKRLDWVSREDIQQFMLAYDAFVWERLYSEEEDPIWFMKFGTTLFFVQDDAILDLPNLWKYCHILINGDTTWKPRWERFLWQKAYWLEWKYIKAWNVEQAVIAMFGDSFNYKWTPFFPSDATDRFVNIAVPADLPIRLQPNIYYKKICNDSNKS